jgi:tetratricopeptide (TPR) repeat protein
VRLGRPVVIKVLPPEMGAGVNVERFEREIQLAAKLQHPHIVPLLTAGSHDDLLYYVMPFIEGESLRAKLAREGELPLGEAVRIMRDVVDALAYAHEHGVVHRDIKPENVLLTAKHAVVTDFGVAKAVSASTDEVSLTSLGVALGTPAYMSPEQAAANPNVDHRADLYAVGALAYEMLCGRPPFSGTNAQAILAAHVTQAPEPCTTHRPAVPPALNTLVLRCLEKHPADRWQRAEELVPHLEAMLTPTGGITPTGTQPVAAVDYEAAARASHPVRVAALFGVGSVALLGLVYLIMMQLGLPDWVFVGTIALLVIALPIALTTGHLERQRALARTTGTVVPTPAGGLHRWLSWRRAIPVGALAFVGLAVVAAGYMGMRLLGIGPVGTLVATGMLEERGRLIVAEFEDRTPEANVSASVTEAFRIDLSQSPIVKLMDPSAVEQALERMHRAPGTVIDVGLAREMAQREGVKAVVAGDIGMLGSGYVVSVRLLATADGTQLVALRETAEDDRALIGAVDRLSAKLRERIGESLRTIRAGEPLAHVTTGSLGALRLYSRGASAQRAGDYERAASLFEEAVAADSGFGMAYRKLAIVLANAGADRSRIVVAATRAYELQDRLPAVERYMAIAAYYAYVEFDRSQTVAAYRSVLELDPERDAALNNLAVALGGMRQHAEAEELYKRALVVADSGTWQHFSGLASVQVRQGKLEEARATVAAFERKMPDNPNALSNQAFLAFLEGDEEAAERYVRRVGEVARQSRTWQRRTEFLLAALDVMHGRLAAAERRMRAQQAIEEERGNLGEALDIAIRVAGHDDLYRDAPEEAIAEVEAALERYPLATIPPTDRRYFELIRLYAGAGRPQRAREIQAESWREVDEALRRQPRWHLAEGHIALAEGNAEQAIAAYRAYYAEVGCNACSLYDLGRAYDAAREPDSALAVYERALSIPDRNRIFYDVVFLGPTYKRLGELHEQVGDRQQALDYYSRFVELWKDADPDLQPVVRDVRERVARLVAEPSE